MQSRGVLGFGGVFIASIFAQTLSLTSTGFNAMVDSLWSGVVEVRVWNAFVSALDIQSGRSGGCSTGRGAGAGFNGRVNGFMRVDSARPVPDQ